jgi:hypothetical protein
MHNYSTNGKTINNYTKEREQLNICYLRVSVEVMESTETGAVLYDRVEEIPPN